MKMQAAKRISVKRLCIETRAKTRSRPSAWLLGLILVLGTSGHVLAGESAKSTGEANTPPGTIEFVGQNLIANAQGVFHRWSLVENAVDLSALESSYVIVEVDLSSLDTNNESRDDHLRTADFFDVEEYPTATVRGYALKALSTSLPSSESKSMGESETGRTRYAISFDIDLHGVSKTLEGEVELVGRAPIVVEGDLELNRVDFGIGNPASRWNPMSIKEIIPIHFRVEL